MRGLCVFCHLIDATGESLKSCTKMVQEWNQTLLRGYSSVVYRDSPVSLASDFSMLATLDPQVIPVTLRWTSVSPSRPPSSLREPVALELRPWKATDPLGMNATSDSDCMSCGVEGRGEEGRGGEGREKEGRGGEGREKEGRGRKRRGGEGKGGEGRGRGGEGREEEARG